MDFQGPLCPCLLSFSTSGWQKSWSSLSSLKQLKGNSIGRAGWSALNDLLQRNTPKGITGRWKFLLFCHFYFIFSTPVQSCLPHTNKLKKGAADGDWESGYPWWRRYMAFLARLESFHMGRWLQQPLVRPHEEDRDRQEATTEIISSLYGLMHTRQSVYMAGLPTGRVWSMPRPQTSRPPKATV